MLVGVVREVMNHEYRVAIAPVGVRELTSGRVVRPAAAAAHAMSPSTLDALAGQLPRPR